MITDVADGYIARNYDQKTVLGTFLDPMSDKVILLIIIVVVGIVVDFRISMIVSSNCCDFSIGI
jgi:cardiolipin synthase